MNAQSGEHRQQSDHKSSDQEVSGCQATRQRQTLRALAHIHECGTVIGVGSRRRIISRRGNDYGLHALHLVFLNTESQITHVGGVGERGIVTGDFRHLVHVGTRLGEAE